MAISMQNSAITKIEDRKISATDSGSRSLPVRMALFALRFYKAYLSILFAGSCRFEPTCSRYAHEAIERFGVRRGVWMGIKRLARCHPLSRKFGHDPVPEKWEVLSSEHDAAGADSSAAQSKEVHL